LSKEGGAFHGKTIIIRLSKMRGKNHYAEVVVLFCRKEEMKASECLRGLLCMRGGIIE